MKDKEIQINELQTILNISSEKASRISRYVILAVRDPFMFGGETGAEKFCESLENVEKIGSAGLYQTYSGEYKGIPITLCMTGTGCPEAEFALVAFLKGAPQVDTIIRVGGVGGMQRDFKPGGIVIASGSVNDDGSTIEYVKQSYPSFSHHEVILAQIEAAEQLNAKYSLGIIRTNDTMFVGYGLSAVNGYIQEEHKKNIEYWNKAGILGGDRETSIILTLTSLFGKRGGSICVNGGNLITGELLSVEDHQSAVDSLIKISYESIALLANWDARKTQAKKRYYYSLLPL